VSGSEFQISRIFAESWPFWVSAPAIASVVVVLTLMGKRFGISTNLETMCTLAGAGKTASFFRRDWRAEAWNLWFAGGAILGGGFAYAFGAKERVVAVSEKAASLFASWGVEQNAGLVPNVFFGGEAWSSPLAWAVIGVSGFLVGFGARWASGCTSGHAISGMADFQKGSFIAVAGFFAGGLLSSWLILPLILGSFSP
jgi:uncharacterized membrane protein YedE/YeeE